MSDVAAALSPIEPLTAHHFVDSFECGRPPLDHFLQRFAFINQKTGSARTYEAHDFEPSPVDPYHLFLLMKDLRAILRCITTG